MVATSYSALYQDLALNAIISRGSRMVRPKQIPGALLDINIKASLMLIRLLNVMTSFSFKVLIEVVE